jgi:DegV family protein with EDD domain
MPIKIITDSGADLPKEIIKKYNIEYIPLIVYLGDEEYLDGQTIEPKEIYDGMRQEKVYKTAQVPYQTFKDLFQKFAQNKESCIYIAFSSGLSGTYQSAVMAKNEILEEYPDFELDIIDSKCATLGFGLGVQKAAQLAQEQKSKQEILDTINHYKNHMEHIFTVDNLEYLYRGGRVSKTAAFVGGLLNIKPILDVEDGKLVPIEKVRGRKKLLKRMIEIIGERGVDLSNQVIGISHGDDAEGAKQIIEMLKESYGCKEFVINMIGGAIGAHSGPGTLAVFFLNI